MTLMGGPIDTRRSPTKVNLLAQERGSAWFKSNCICTVPFGYPGAGREVYPGFLQLTGFMAMNIDRHVTAHLEFFDHLVSGDGDSARKHREFYDEYRAVMDLPAEFYLQTVDTVFVKHALPKGEMTHRGAPVDLAAIRRVGLLTVEGENDDISGLGQTLAAQDLCQQPSAIHEGTLSAGQGRSLRRVQRFAFPQRDRAADPGVSSLADAAGQGLEAGRNRLNLGFWLLPGVHAPSRAALTGSLRGALRTEFDPKHRDSKPKSPQLF